MTQQHLIGELSVYLEQLQAAAEHGAAQDVARLRQLVAARALALADRLCWQSLSRGDVTAFTRQAKASADLRQFGVCAGLLPGGSYPR